MKAASRKNDADRLPRMEPVAGSDGKLFIIRETPSERACSVLACGLRMWPSRVRQIIFTTDPNAPVMGADEKL